MLSASLAFHRLFADNPADLRVKATLTLADATLLNLEGEDFMEGGFSFSTASSTESAFVIGAATVGGFDCTLNNIDGKFDEYDFTGAEIVPYVGVELAPGNVEWLCKGRFWVEQPDSYGNTIGLSCVDNMTLLEKPYSDVNTSYPASLQTIVSNICTACGIVFVTPDFPNKTYQVAERPDDDSLTCLQMVSYVAQLACSWACVDTNGRLALRWYRTDWMDDERWLDGGTYLTATTPYSDGDTADGGSFHSGGANVDGGSFDVVPSYALLQDIYDLTISTDDVVITGVKVTATGDDNNDGETSLYGSDGYVLEVAGNPLVLLGKASAVASMVGSLVVGMRFRPFSARADVDPTVEAGDPVMFADAKGNYYKSFFTSCAWSVTGGSQAACNAETPARNSAATYSAVTAAIVANRKALRHEITAREAAVQNLANIIAASSGLYMTEQVQPDQSIIYYLHDKPTLAQSTIVWKFTAAAFAVSVDGGQTYPFGFDAWGNAILNSIYAIGINATYIHGGTLTLGGQDNVNGSLVVYDSVGNSIATIDNMGTVLWHLTSLRNGSTNTNGVLVEASEIDTTSGHFFNAVTGYSSTSGDSYRIPAFKVASTTTSKSTRRGNIYLVPRLSINSNYENYYKSTVYSDAPLQIIGGIDIETTESDYPTLYLGPSYSGLMYGAPPQASTGTAYRTGVSAYYVLPNKVLMTGSSIEIQPSLTTSSRFVMNASTLTIGVNSNVKINTTMYGNLTVNGNLSVSGTKPRLVETDGYGKRYLYAYETPMPYFGDLGSGVIGEDGLCYVEVDDIFSETARADLPYQVFLQKCGQGDLWVESKSRTHFVVAGTPGLGFDWEIKCRQRGYEALRMEQPEFDPADIHDDSDEVGNPEEAYDWEYGYIDEQERILYEAA